jgi:hypothetical protein
LTPDHRHRLGRTLALVFLLGVGLALLVLALDQLLFAGVSLERVRTVGQLRFGARVLVVVYSAVSEESIFRLGLATLAASLAFLLLRGLTRRAAVLSLWLGVLVACVLFGLAHVANLPHVPHPYLRAITLNGVAGLALGWLYWFRGLEAAIVAHLGADVTIYLLVASLLQDWRGCASDRRARPVVLVLRR